MFKIIKMSGRTPPCENCKKRRSEIQVDGDSDLTKLKLCNPCFHSLDDAIAEHTRVTT